MPRGAGVSASKSPWPSIDAGKAIPWVEKRTKLALAKSQKEAIRVALASKVLVITGGPGVGKTTLVNSLLKILLATAVAIPLRPDRPRRKEPVRRYRPQSQDHSSSARERPEDRGLPVQ